MLKALCGMSSLDLAINELTHLWDRFQLPDMFFLDLLGVGFFGGFVKVCRVYVFGVCWVFFCFCGVWFPFSSHLFSMFFLAALFLRFLFDVVWGGQNARFCSGFGVLLRPSK